MASYYEYHLERANSHFRDNRVIWNNHTCVRACVRETAKTSLACIASIVCTHAFSSGSYAKSSYSCPNTQCLFQMWADGLSAGWSRIIETQFNRDHNKRDVQETKLDNPIKSKLLLDQEVRWSICVSSRTCAWFRFILYINRSYM